MNLGLDNKKQVYALAGLGAVMLYVVYSTFFADSSSKPAPAPKPAVAEDGGAASPIAPAPGASTPSVPAPAPRQLSSNRAKSDEFHPTLRSKRKEDQIDPLTVDPTLRLDLLAKVQDVKLDGGQRNLFQFGAPEKVAAVLKGEEAKILPKAPEKMGPPVAQPVVTAANSKPAEPAAPPPPPFTPKYYGLATKQVDGKKTAFFLDGEDIILATEGMTVKKRYKLMRINPSSVVVQETESKKEQTVQISEDAGGTAS